MKPILSDEELQALRNKCKSCEIETYDDATEQDYCINDEWFNEFAQLAAQKGYEKQPCICDGCSRDNIMKDLTVLCSKCYDKQRNETRKEAEQRGYIRGCKDGVFAGTKIIEQRVAEEIFKDIERLKGSGVLDINDMIRLKKKYEVK
jgi:hypothetical protein